MRWLETQTGPACPAPMTVIPAPVTANTSIQTAHRLDVGDLAASTAKATAIRADWSAFT
jgi:hypothetical protein